MNLISRRARAVMVGTLLLPLTSCLSVSWQVAWNEEPIAESATADLAKTRATIDDVFERIGAPNIVRRATEGGAWLYWISARNGDFGLDFSIPIRFASVSLSWQDDAERYDAVAVRLDPEFRVLEVRRGALNNLLKGAIDPTRRRRSRAFSLDPTS
ncbi:MAG: hypothetical protein KDC95_23365 [Planctomycetes bacterium]|nr:hypothetical protein [Planctomycetota bacterium]